LVITGAEQGSWVVTDPRRVQAGSLPVDAAWLGLVRHACLPTGVAGSAEWRDHTDGVTGQAGRQPSWREVRCGRETRAYCSMAPLRGDGESRYQLAAEGGGGRRCQAMAIYIPQLTFDRLVAGRMGPPTRLQTYCECRGRAASPNYRSRSVITTADRSCRCPSSAAHPDTPQAADTCREAGGPSHNPAARAWFPRSRAMCC
jgi:hypothetical protein